MANQIAAAMISSALVQPIPQVKSTSDKHVPTKEPQSVLIEKPSDPETAKLFETTLNKLNAVLQKASSELELKVDSETGKTVFKIVDSNGFTLMQVPSEELLALSRKLKDFEKHLDTPTGVLIDKES